MFCFVRWRASGHAFRVSGKLEFYYTQVSLQFPFSLFCSRTLVLVWLISRPVIGAIITIVHWLFLGNATFGALNKDSHRSLEIKESIDFVLKLKNFPQGPEILENGVLGAKHLELEHRPHIHNKALELKAMWRNLQRPETGLNQSPVVTLQNPPTTTTPPPPPCPQAIWTCTQLNYDSTEHGSGWAVHIQRWDQMREVMSAGSEMKLRLKPYGAAVLAKLQMLDPCRVWNGHLLLA